MALQKFPSRISFFLKSRWRVSLKPILILITLWRLRPLSLAFRYFIYLLVHAFLSSIKAVLSERRYAQGMSFFVRTWCKNWVGHYHTDGQRLSIESFEDMLMLREWYEAETRWRLAQLGDSRGRIFVDVGAYFGLFTILLSRRYRRVIAFEPNPVVFGRLQDNIRRNGLAERCHAVHAAVSSSPEPWINLFVDPDAPNSSSIAGAPSPSATPRRVPNTTLDGALRQECESDATFVLKIDAEGAELDVLTGGTEFVLPRTVAAIIECFSPERAEEIKKLMERFGLTFIKVLDGRNLFFCRTREERSLSDKTGSFPR